jgi:hypothetical protein
MNLVMYLRPFAALTAAAGILAGSVGLAQTPTLGELAKKEEERRKAVAGASKVMTNQDLPKTKGAPRSGPDVKPPAGQDTKAAAIAEEPREEKDEAWWRARMSQAREELRRNEAFAEALQSRINALTNDFAARDDPFQRARIGEDRVRALAEMDRVKADIEVQKKKIAEIEEEARRAGVPPGWLR